MNDDESQGSPWENLPAENIGMLLALAQRLAASQYHAMLDPLKLTPVQSQILWTINQQGEITAGALAEMYLVKAPVMTAIVDYLVRLDYVERRRDCSDRRRSLLAITSAGQEILAQLGEIRQNMLKYLTRGLTEEEVSQFTSTLIKMVTTMEDPERLARHYFDKDEQISTHRSPQSQKRAASHHPGSPK